MPMVTVKGQGYVIVKRYGVDRETVQFASYSDVSVKARLIFIIVVWHRWHNADADFSVGIFVEGEESSPGLGPRVDYAFQFQDYSEERVISTVMVEFQATDPRKS
ncbi:Actin Filament-Associated Protein 1-Like 1 [Manis pentadactyla]|nr:Actin Filament-Associated Protein 1-Like 1 [Manis pentadactyla]